MIGSETVRAQVTLTSSNLPIVLINTDGQEIPNEPKITASMQIIDNGPGQLNHPTDPPNDYVGYIGIELRGSKSQAISDKKPYAIETRDADGNDLAYPLLGMPAESDWAFLAPYSDKSMIRDALTLNLAREIMPWAARNRFVEVILNGDYRGIYLVTERIKRSEARIDIKKTKPTDLSGDDVTGGYIIKIDKTEGGFSDGWNSPYPPEPGKPQVIYYQYEYPKPEEIAPEQKQYIQQWMTAFETVAQGANFSDSLLGYRHYLDVASFVDFLLMNELTKNVDSYRISAYLWKDRDSEDPRLHAGPVWDYNIAMGNANYCSGNEYKGWALDFNRVCPDDERKVPFWWARLWQDQNFLLQVRSRWQSLRNGPFSDTRILDQVDSMTVLLHTAQVRNFEKWPILEEYVWPNVFCCGTYDQHVQHLRSWLLHRLHWMDETMATPYAGQYDPGQYFSPEISPNPSYGALTFRYYVRHNTSVLIRVYDQIGRQVAKLTDEPFFDGENELNWTYSLAPGVYFFTIRVDGKVVSTASFVAGRQ